MSAADDGLAAWIAPVRTALLIIDTQRDFTAARGAMGRAGADLSTVPAALAAIARLAAAARAARTLVVFTRLQTTARTDSAVWAAQIRRRDGDADEDAAICREGSPGAEFSGITPRPDELIVDKRRYSAFFATDLDNALRARRIDTLVICGLTTECCIDCTARDAFHLDYHVFIAADACAAYDADLHDVALKSLGLNCALIAQSDDVARAWER